MKNVALLLGALFLTALACAQNTQAFALVSLQRMTFPPYGGGTILDCILIHPDGSFHREHQQMDTAGVNWTDIYEGKLSQPQLDGLVAAVDTAEFKTIAATTPMGGLRHVKADESLIVNIFRGMSSQAFALMDSAERKPHEQTVKPLLTWWKAIERQKLPKLKGAKPTGCSYDPAEVGKGPTDNVPRPH